MKVAHVCVYPPKNAKHVSESGAASYTKNLVTNLPAEGLEIHVVCNQINDQTGQYQEGHATVHRSFKRNISFLWQINRTLKQLAPDVIHIQQELALFGNIITAYLLPLLVLIWRKRTVVTLHGVVSLAGINKHFVKSNGFAPAPVWMVRLGLRALYAPLAAWPRRVIVHEPLFKQILVQEYGIADKKIAVIPHGVENFDPLPRAIARQQLQLEPDQQVVLFMGYAAGYKGIDLLLEGFAEFARANKKAILLVGAGMHPKFKDDPAYKTVYTGLQQKAEQLIPAGQHRWIGFIPETEVANYYSAADVSVYPYNLAIASSGPMAFAIGYNKPFLASQAFANVFDEQLIFAATPTALAAKLDDFFANQAQFSQHIAQLRSERLWQQVGQQAANLYKTVGNAHD